VTVATEQAATDVAHAVGMRTDDALLAAVRQARQSLAEAGPGWTRAVGDFEKVSLPRGDGDVLRDLLTEAGARVVIEVGLAYGSSALAIAEALVSQGHEDAQHLIIDAYQDQFRGAGWGAVTAAGLARLFTLVADRSQLVLARLVTQRFVADAAFVDGSHIFHNVFVDLYYLRELVRPGGLVVLDDCQWPSVATAVDYFEVNTSWRPVAVPSPSRLRAFRLPVDPVEPSFRDFRPFGSASSGWLSDRP
jgi:predicted O-methyltransferase YrrM